MVTEVCGARLPRFQVTVATGIPLAIQPPVQPAYVELAGTVSVTTTLLAVAVPSLVTTSVYVMGSPGEICPVGSLLLVIDRAGANTVASAGFDTAGSVNANSS